MSTKKKILVVGSWSVFAFVILTLTTAKIETPFDGNDTYGFPLTFFVRFSGMRISYPLNPTEIKIIYLLIDALFSLIMGLLLWFAARKIKLGLSKKKYDT